MAACSPVGASTQHIRLWEMQETQPATSVQMLTGHTNLVLGLAFAPDGRTLASGSWDRTVKLWDVESLRCARRSQDTPTGCFAWPGARMGVCWPVAALDQTIWLWDVERSSYRTVLHGHTAVV